MEQSWHTLNRRKPKPDPVFFWGSWIIGTIAVLLLGIETVVQIWMRHHS